ncbi:MAG: type II toxin-antitoxin system VapC family toxin [Lewinellaceae bacterium]|nr:type II toxin-antitoxin system VapC family toxin [Lewinellaceae bacterium]
MGTTYLIDTNSAIYYLNELLPKKGMDFLERALNESGSFLSVISKIELLGWQAPTVEAMEQIESFVDDSIVLPLDDRIVGKTIEIRRSLKIKLPDAVIVSTALVYDFTLLSRNDADFRRVPGLKYLNLFSDL